jgi:hypothetical protein
VKGKQVLENSLKDLKATVEPSYNFGPMKLKLPDDVIVRLNEICDSEESVVEDYSPYLAGRIKNGKQTGLKLEAFNKEIINFLYTSTRSYIYNTLGNSDVKLNEFDIRLGKMWMVSQLEKDFNPVHSHTGVVAGIIYLKVPPQVNLQTLEGCLTFIYGDYHYGSLKNHGPISIQPAVGDMYIFPAWLLHCVWPFYGEGERRCLAYNFYNAKIT